MKKNRRKSREVALSALYAADMRPTEDPLMVFALVAETAEVDMDDIAYARGLFTNAIARSTSTDALISEFAKNWDIKRMAAIDRNVLRLAITEFAEQFDVPYKVVIDEAVELAKTFGAEESGKFVNGLLDTIYRERIKK